MNKNNVTELVFVIDMSGSMSHLTDDTIGGFNSLIKKHSSGDGEVLVTTYLFNDSSKMIHDRKRISEVEPMTEKEYCASGCTALIDSLGEAIDHIASIHRYARAEDIPEHTLFIVTTDGMENASHKYNADEVRKKVKHEQDKYGWEFVFLAANIDAVETAKRYGIKESRAVNYYADRLGTENLYCAASEAVFAMRSKKSLSDSAWRDKADRDFNSRKK